MLVMTAQARLQRLGRRGRYPLFFISKKDNKFLNLKVDKK